MRAKPGGAEPRERAARGPLRRPWLPGPVRDAPKQISLLFRIRGLRGTIGTSGRVGHGAQPERDGNGKKSMKGAKAGQWEKGM